MTARLKKTQREYSPTSNPNAAPWLYTRRSCTQSPMTASGRRRASRASASSLVMTSETTIAAAVPQNSRRSAALSIFLLRLALDAQPGVRQRVEPVEADLIAALLALAEALGRAIEPSQRFVHVPEVPALLRREQERLLPLHRIGALVGHMEGVTREVAVGGLQARVERFAVMSQLLHHPGALLEQSLLEVAQLLLAEAALDLRLDFHLGRFRRHFIWFRPFVRRGDAARWSRGSPRCPFRESGPRCRAPLPAASAGRASHPRRMPGMLRSPRPHRPHRRRSIQCASCIHTPPPCGDAARGSRPRVPGLPAPGPRSAADRGRRRRGRRPGPASRPRPRG